MRKIFATLSAVFLLGVSAQSQVVINEIMYNIPGTGENEEFIELYNAGSSTVDISNYALSLGVNYTFGTMSLNPGAYAVVAFDSASFHTSWGFAPDGEWSGGLSNSGETILLLDGTGAVVDSVRYDDVSPWPTEPDGQGRSLQLCDATTDNADGNNWGFTNTQNGMNGTTNTDSLYASPGAMNMCVVVIPPPPPSYPLYSFGQINGLNASGAADSVGVTCELRGITHCIDFRFNGLDFKFANSNNTAGITVFSFSDVDNYTVTAGDSLHIWGTVSQYNGLLQFTPDSIAVISQGNATASPMTVTSLSEATENRLVTLASVHLVDTAAWTTGQGTTGFNVQVTDGSSDTILVRIDNDVTDLYNMSAPLGTFSITGWGSQFDPSDPRDEGYQLQPCGISMLTNTTEIENNSYDVAIFPNPVSGSLNIQSDIEIESIYVFNTLGQEVLTINNVNTSTTQISTSTLENGVYVISVVTDSKIMTQQFQVVK